MKKQFIYIKKAVVLALMIPAVILSSCSLEEDPVNISARELAKTSEGALQLVTGIYGTMWSSYLMKKTYQEWIDMDHDLNGAQKWVVAGAGQGNVTTHWGYNGNSDLFVVFYRIINRCNEAKAGLETADLSNPKIGQRYGEVLFMRAWAYFNLVRMYGPVPLRISVTSEDNCPRSPIADVYNVITTDLEDAIKHLQYPNSGHVGGWGHADRTAARILLARVYNTMASGKLAGDKVKMYANIYNQTAQAAGNAEDESLSKLEWKEFTTIPVMGNHSGALEDGYAAFNAAELYSKAIVQCDSVINRKGIDYDLMPEWTKLWGRPNYRNKEFVWGASSANKIDYISAGGLWYYIPMAYGASNYVALSDGCWAMYKYDKNSTQNDERASKGVFHYWKNGTFLEDRQWYRFPTGDTQYSTAPDGRKPASSTEYVKDGVKSVTGWYRAAAYSNKWYFGDITDPKPMYSSIGSETEPQDLILIRFAEAYLLRAEARNEVGQSSGALQDLNVIRDRAKASAYNETDQVQLRSLILQERGIEFTQEFNRRFDLIRWGMYLNVMNTTQTILSPVDETITLVREPRCLLTAVPTIEIQANKQFGPNNPGW